MTQQNLCSDDHSCEVSNVIVVCGEQRKRRDVIIKGNPSRRQADLDDRVSEGEMTEIFPDRTTRQVKQCYIN